MSAKNVKSCSVCESYLETQIGVLKISHCSKGVHSIQIGEKENILLSNSCNDLKRGKKAKCLLNTLNWLKDYFDGDILQKPPAVCPLVMQSKGAFTQQVWSTLQTDIPPGHTVTYGALAQLSGRPGAARAVGTAMRRNPAPLVVPCHRVVKGGGALGNYSGGGGAALKAWLLKHEGAEEPGTACDALSPRGEGRRCPGDLLGGQRCYVEGVASEACGADFNK
ncbi:hypothetical protein JTE90_013815 [Oedothorax gibbosus]|uniref:Methylated-DNA--protein-cysteine methyltransferase n=1 Tax=Oedothorax gibbosus TaxID=931172 RepID=A0AAV6VIN0_9ARAC|nr:hypothetical protein JTE90_013815 [Oedothorax gibbosus]